MVKLCRSFIQWISNVCRNDPVIGLAGGHLCPRYRLPMHPIPGSTWNPFLLNLRQSVKSADNLEPYTLYPVPLITHYN